MSDSDDNRLEDDDFDFKKKQNKDNKKGAGPEIKTEKIENQHMDERIELDSEGQSEDIKSEQEEEDDQKQDDSMEHSQKPSGKQGGRQNYTREDEEQDFESKGPSIPGAYNPADYAHLDVSNEIKELFRYITRYQPETKELDAKLKPFIPDYYPTIGEVDAYIKMPRPDGKEENLGLQILDEPCLNQSNRAIAILIGQNTIVDPGSKKTLDVVSIKNAEKNTKEIQTWINKVGEVRKIKQPHNVSYTKPMPEIDDLMQVWPQEIEEALQVLKIPSEELDFNLADFSKLACAIVDIPVHDKPEDGNIIESLHVLFTLYSEFKSNQHFQQNKNDQNYDQMQLQIN